MSLTATFDDTAGKVTLVTASAPSTADVVHLERSTDQVTWTDVRGGQAVALSGGGATFTDYEYAAGVQNFYRASYVDTSVPAFTSGTALAATAAGASVTRAYASGVAGVGKVNFVVANCSKSTATVTLTTAAGWTVLDTIGTSTVIAYTTAATPGTPTFTATGTASGDVLVCFGFAWSNVAAPPKVTNKQRNVAATTINFPTITAPAPAGFGFLAVVQNAVATSLSPVPTQFGTATGYVYGVYPLGATLAASTVPVAGGSSAISSVFEAFMAQAPFVSRDTGTVTPAQTSVWLKSPTRPFLNRRVTVIDFDDLTRASRSGVFDVIGRTLQVAVTDLMSGRSTSIVLRTTTSEEADDLDLMIAVGEVLFLQAVGGSALPTLYAVPGGVTRTRVAQTSAVRRFTLPLTEVAVPDLTLAAVQSTWQTVINTYASWADLIAAKATWSDVLQIVGTAADVITS